MGGCDWRGCHWVGGRSPSGAGGVLGDLAEAEADGVGAVGAAGGEDALAVAVEARGVDEGADGAVAVVVEDEEHPDVREAVQAEHGVRAVAEENAQPRPRRWGDVALCAGGACGWSLAEME
jgi:hypothetical protein